MAKGSYGDSIEVILGLNDSEAKRKIAILRREIQELAGLTASVSPTGAARRPGIVPGSRQYQREIARMTGQMGLVTPTGFTKGSSQWRDPATGQFVKSTDPRTGISQQFEKGVSRDLEVQRKEIEKTREASDDATKSKKNLGNSMTGMAKKAMKVVPAWIMIRGAYMAVIQTVQDVIKTFIDFEKEMARVGTVTGDVAGDNSKDLEMLKQTALDYSAGATRGFKEAATALYTLGSAGLNVTEQMQGLQHVMDLSIGTLSDVEQIGKLVAGAYNVFGEEMEGAYTASQKMKKISDVLAYTYSSHQVELSQLSNAFGYVGAVGSMVNITFEQITSTLGFLNTNMLQGCVSEDTEILTNQGWKFFKDLDKTEKVATLNLSDHSLEYQKPQRYIKYNYDGKMLHQKNSHLDFLLTPNHRVLYQDGKKLEFGEASKTFNKNKSLLVNKQANETIISNKEDWVSYNGNVYCVEVPNSTIFIRRKGKTVWTGNSRAGTSLMNAFVRLATEGDRLSDLGVVFDPSKPMDFVNIMEQLNDIYGDQALSMDNLKELMEVFGRRGGRAAAIIIARFEAWKKTMGDTKASFDDFSRHMRRQVETTLPAAWDKFWNSLKASAGKNLRDMGVTTALEAATMRNNLIAALKDLDKEFSVDITDSLSKAMKDIDTGFLDQLKYEFQLLGEGLTGLQLHKTIPFNLDELGTKKFVAMLQRDFDNIELESFLTYLNNIRNEQRLIERSAIETGEVKDNMTSILEKHLSLNDRLEKIGKRLTEESRDQIDINEELNKIADEYAKRGDWSAERKESFVKLLQQEFDITQKIAIAEGAANEKRLKALRYQIMEAQFSNEVALGLDERYATQFKINHLLGEINEKIEKQKEAGEDIQTLRFDELLNAEKLEEVIRRISGTEGDINELLKLRVELQEQGLVKITEYAEQIRSAMKEGIADAIKDDEKTIIDVFKGVSDAFRDSMVDAFAEGLTTSIMDVTGLDVLGGGIADIIGEAHKEGGYFVSENLLHAYDVGGTDSAEKQAIAGYIASEEMKKSIEEGGKEVSDGISESFQNEGNWFLKTLDGIFHKHGEFFAKFLPTEIPEDEKIAFKDIFQTPKWLSPSKEIDLGNIEVVKPKPDDSFYPEWGDALTDRIREESYPDWAKNLIDETEDTTEAIDDSSEKNAQQQEETNKILKQLHKVFGERTSLTGAAFARRARDISQGTQFGLPGFGEGGWWDQPIGYGDPKGGVSGYPGGYAPTRTVGTTRGQMLGFGVTSAMGIHQAATAESIGGIMSGLGSIGIGAGAAGIGGAGGVLGMGALIPGIGIALAIGGMLASMFSTSKQVQREERESVQQITSKIDVTNNELEWVNRNLIDMKNELSYIMQRSFYFRERRPNEEFAIDAGRGGQV